jgi:predicted nuclease of predicted toxin-antitoxin system
MKIYLDENLSQHVAKALNNLNQGYFSNIEVHSTIEVFGRGVTDEKLIPNIGNEGSVLITKDFNIKKTHL